MNEHNISQAELVLACPELTPTLDFFRNLLGFRISTIYPADDPAVVELTGYGIRIQLQKSDHRDQSRIRLFCNEPEMIANGVSTLTAPNGTTIELDSKNDDITIPPLDSTFVLSNNNDDSSWIDGRAGMQYRDLIPGRQGGRFIASHIRIPGGGPVPDYVHFHKIRFQMIFCYKGWVKVVYEDQGQPFKMESGDCVLQPPMIRHRVLESSENLEVIEIGCPAAHYTCVDHDLILPNDKIDKQKSFSGQKFVRHQASKSVWQPWRYDGYVARDLGIGSATDRLAGVRVARPEGQLSSPFQSHSNEFVFWFILQGNLVLSSERQEHSMQSGDAVTIPAGMQYSIQECSQDLEILEVSLPDTISTC